MTGCETCGAPLPPPHPSGRGARRRFCAECANARAGARNRNRGRTRRGREWASYDVRVPPEPTAGEIRAARRRET